MQAAEAPLIAQGFQVQGPEVPPRGNQGFITHHICAAAQGHFDHSRGGRDMIPLSLLGEGCSGCHRQGRTRTRFALAKH